MVLLKSHEKFLLLNKPEKGTFAITAVETENVKPVREKRVHGKSKLRKTQKTCFSC